MTLLQSLFLGILQGIAEFLPISSSGHLSLFQSLFGLEDVPVLFDVFLHLATLAAVIIYFRKTIGKLICVLFRWLTLKKAEDESEKESRKMIVALLVTTFITGVLGIATSKFLPDLSVKFVCIGFLVTAILLSLSAVIERKNKDTQEKSPDTVQALIIGFAQGIGTLPGISRSGSTIAGALFCGVNRKVAGEYSFIASIPAILGAFLLELKDLDKMTDSVGTVAIAIGCISAFVAGYLSLAFLMKLIRKGKLEWFAAYLIPLSILGFIFL